MHYDNYDPPLDDNYYPKVKNRSSIGWRQIDKQMIFDLFLTYLEVWGVLGGIVVINDALCVLAHRPTITRTQAPTELRRHLADHVMPPASQELSSLEILSESDSNTR
eukprot:939891-Amphidinium_carterae.1